MFETGDIIVLQAIRLQLQVFKWSFEVQYAGHEITNYVDQYPSISTTWHPFVDLWTFQKKLSLEFCWYPFLETVS